MRQNISKHYIFHYRFALFTSISASKKRVFVLRAFLVFRQSCLKGEGCEESKSPSYIYFPASTSSCAISSLYLWGRFLHTSEIKTINLHTLQTWWKNKSICALWDTNAHGFSSKSVKRIELRTKLMLTLWQTGRLTVYNKKLQVNQKNTVNNHCTSIV